MFLPKEGAWEGVFLQCALGYAQCLYHTAWAGKVFFYSVPWAMLSAYTTRPGLAVGSSPYFSGDADCLLSQDPQPGSRAFRSLTDSESDFSLSLFSV